MGSLDLENHPHQLHRPHPAERFALVQRVTTQALNILLEMHPSGQLFHVNSTFMEGAASHICASFVDIHFC